MICGFCSEALDGRPDACPACQQSPLLDGRYRLDSIVGRGAMGVTYKAERLEDGLQVAIKELPFRRIDALKTKALFEREARVLEQLDHPGIPAYLDDFLAGMGKHQSLHLVQAFVDGETLRARMDQQRWREDEVLRLMAEVADILTYLHELSPPVIHRDIKPGNIMCRADGSLALIDFGAVRDALDDDRLGGSTVVGTYGFMAPEQFKGDATPATDLYAFGVTLVALFSRKTPDAMVDVSGRLAWQTHVSVSEQTEDLLGDLLQLDPTLRPQRTRDVAARCRQIADDIEAGRAAPRPAPNAPQFAPPAVALPEPALVVHTTAPATTQPKNSAALIAGIGAVVVLLIGTCTAMVTVQSDVPSPYKTAAERCGGKPCPPVAQGLKGLRFGMTRAEATEALPELAGASETKSSVSFNSGALLLEGGGFRLPPKLPGVSLSVSTSLGNLPANCELNFADQDRLTRMRCVLAKQPTRETHLAAEQALVGALTERYGPPSYAKLPDKQLAGITSHDAAWEWSDAEAKLELRSEFTDFGNLIQTIEMKPKSELILENTGEAHWRVVREIEAAEDKKARAEQARKQREIEEAARKAREALKGGKLGDDL